MSTWYHIYFFISRVIPAVHFSSAPAAMPDAHKSESFHGGLAAPRPITLEFTPGSPKFMNGSRESLGNTNSSNLEYYFCNLCFLVVKNKYSTVFGQSSTMIFYVLISRIKIMNSWKILLNKIALILQLPNVMVANSPGLRCPLRLSKCQPELPCITRAIILMESEYKIFCTCTITTLLLFIYVDNYVLRFHIHVTKTDN